MSAAPLPPELRSTARASRLSSLVGLATSRPVTVVVLVGLLAGLATLAARRLELGGNIYDLFPRAPGPVADLALYMRHFGGHDELVALVRGSEPAAVERAARVLGAELARSSLLAKVRSGVEGAEASEGLARSLLLLAGPEAWPEVERRLTRGRKAQVTRLRQLLLASFAPVSPLVTYDPLGLGPLVLQGLEVGVGRRSGLYASPDGRAALLFAQPRRPASDGEFCAQLARYLAGLTGARDGVQIEFTGAHLYAHYMAEAFKRDLALSSVLALVGVALIQFLFFRSLRLIPLSALTAGTALSWTLAIAALTFGQLNALSLAFAALFIGMSDDALIHITAETRAFAALAPAERMRLSVLAVAPAMLTATLTVVAAFLCFSLSSFTGLAHTGLLAACGLGMNLLLALLLFPALGTLLPPGPGPSGTTLVDQWLGRLSAGAQRYRLFVLAGVVLLSGLALLATRELRFSEDLARLAPAEIPPAAADRALAEAFERAPNRLLVLVESEAREELLRTNDRIAESLAAMRRGGTIAGYLSLAQLLPSQATQQARRARLQALDPQHLAAELRVELEAAGLRAEEFNPFFAALRAPTPLTLESLPAALSPLVGRYLVREAKRTLVATIVYPRPGLGPRAFAAAMERLSTERVHVRVTGSAPAGVQLGHLLRRDLLVISGTTLLAVLLLLAALVRRLWPIIATVLSLLFAGVLFAAALRLLHLEMDLYNLMVIPVIIGYGVDDHLYVVHRSVREGLRQGIRESGRPVLAATLSTMAAFAALVCCELPGLHTLGLTGTLGLGLGLATSLIVMPALLALAPFYRDTGAQP